MTAPLPADPPPDSVVRVRRGRVVFKARRPAALVVPFALFTEAAGVAMLAGGIPIAPFVMAAPVVALLLTGLVLRPTLELTREGLVQRQYPFSSLTRWEVIDALAVVRAGNRVILGYRLVPGIPPPRRQPAAALLRAAGSEYDGGWFADAIAGRPEGTLEIVERYRQDPALRESLPPRR